METDLSRSDRYVRALEFAEQQVKRLVERHPDFFPMYTSGGHWDRVGELWTDWCGGFLAGMMWLFHGRTADSEWRRLAERYSTLLEHRKGDREVHDLGFIFLNTYRRWHALSGEASRMDVVAEAGLTMSKRFQPKGRYMASFLGPHSLFVDIMMNVPLLFVAAEWVEATDETLARELREVATAHCVTSQQYLVREDGSTAHEAIFDLETGRFLRESTQQGLRADSCWSRGLAWALYGFGTVYAHTRDRRFLETARRCADCFLRRLPPGGVPYWDFDVPEDSQPLWDSSAAAIAASGMLQLAGLVDAQGARERYREGALGLLDRLCSDEFLASSTPGWEGVLRHGVYHMHKGLGVDESVMWGDHFFVEALTLALGTTKGAES